MFDDYLENSIVYKELEEFFQAFFERLSINLSSYLFPYYNTKFSNGLSFMDADPIFSAKCLSDGCVVKIVLDEDIDKVNTFENGKEKVIIGNVNNLNDILHEVKLWVGK